MLLFFVCFLGGFVGYFLGWVCFRGFVRGFGDVFCVCFILCVWMCVFCVIFGVFYIVFLLNSKLKVLIDRDWPLLSKTFYFPYQYDTYKWPKQEQLTGKDGWWKLHISNCPKIMAVMVSFTCAVDKSATIPVQGVVAMHQGQIHQVVCGHCTVGWEELQDSCVYNYVQLYNTVTHFIQVLWFRQSAWIK